MIDRKRWILIAGIVLDGVGAVVIALSLPEAGLTASIGVGCLLIGTLLISFGLERSRSIEDSDSPAKPTEARLKRWKPEQELRAATPRRVRLAPLAQVIVFSWTAMILVGGFLLWERVAGLEPGHPARAVIDEAGAQGVAAVHEKRVRQTANGEPRYYLYYHFADAEDRELRASAQVSAEIYRRYDEGDQLEVVYLPEDLALHYLPEITRSARTIRIGLAIGAVLLALAVVLDIQRRRHRRLVSRGEAAAAVVERVTRRGSARAYEARYKVGGREGVVKAVERGRTIEPGDLATVLYEPSKPEDVLLYRTSLYRAI